MSKWYASLSQCMKFSVGSLDRENLCTGCIVRTACLLWCEVLAVSSASHLQLSLLFVVAAADGVCCVLSVPTLTFVVDELLAFDAEYYVVIIHLGLFLAGSGILFTHFL